ncbi:hypothetical protein NP233_g4175 [Leucocoprinus birnbaumii]|uniref:F-box domain-containing protein n=1 Tax=Leucocoprinus birnbaumii TaxID=56174 RepID=A0AAD5YT35_9AGAR|nr:hypothetical protein NP233_g4175 [Leucocoprinus birnbaumii]
MVSALHRKLRTNDPPTRGEILNARTALASSLARAKGLEEAVMQLENRLNTLERSKHQLSALLKSHSAFIAPVRRLHPEILQEVFYHCLPRAHNTLMSNREGPLWLGQVCRHWREIVYSTPRLWASIHIIASPSPYSSHPLDVSRREAVASWLSRSGVLPLSISISNAGREPVGRRCCFSRRSPSNDYVQPYLDLITPFAHRWRNLFLTLYYFDWTDFLNRLDGSDVPMLQSLHIEGDKPRRYPDKIDISLLSRENSILRVPSLRVISLPTFYSQLSELQAPWGQLTGLDLGARGLELSDVDKMLRLCPDLESCRIRIVDYGLEFDPASPVDAYQMTPITLFKLQTLHVVVDSSCSLTSSINALFLDHLTTPTLVHLTYEQLGYSLHPRRRFSVDSTTSNVTQTIDNHSLLLTSLCSFLLRLTYPLEELDYRQQEFSVTWAQKILPLVPNLKRLSLKGYEIAAPAIVHPPLLHSALPSAPPSPTNDFILYQLMPTEAFNHDNMMQISISDDGFEQAGALPCFCPHLEVFKCFDATFTPQAILQFLRARTVDHEINNLAHLRKVSIAYSFAHGNSILWTQEDGYKLEKEIRKLEKKTGVQVEVCQGTSKFYTRNPAWPSPIPWAYQGISPSLNVGRPLGPLSF